VEAELLHEFLRFGAQAVAYPSIVASGPNACILHYRDNNREMIDGDLLLIDAGCEYDLYASDITRTFPVNGRFTARQKAIYDLVLATQRATFDSVRPGVRLRDLNRVARRYMKDHSGKLCGARTCDDYFVHGVGHWLGMDVHDPGDDNAPLAPGMVLTIEPGIYLPAESLGIRIEDDVLVTPTGGEWLSTRVPRTTDAIERLMAAGGGTRRP
jgi:Xaa-Pro aminopeptidase